MTIQDLENAVFNIENDIYQSTTCEYFNMSLSSNGFVQAVSFCGIWLWDSEEDDREYIDEEEDIKIPIEQHLRKRLNEELAKLATINIPE